MNRAARAHWQSLNRRIKACAFVRVIDQAGMNPSSADVLSWGDGVWTQITDLANLTERRDDDNEYSEPGPQTIALVAEIYAKRERLLEGLRVLGRPDKIDNVLRMRRAGS
jgi:hypothetical protein